MRATAVGIGAAAGMGAVGSTAGTVEAIDWKDAGTIAASGLLGGPVGLAWAIREVTVSNSEPLDEGLTPDAYKQAVLEAGKAAQSRNASTIIDNQNLLSGAENIAYTEGKIAALEALNNQKSESEVLSAATTAVDSHATIVKKNLLKSWNESVNQVESLNSRASEFTDVDPPLTLRWSIDGGSAGTRPILHNTVSHTLPDGSTFDLEQIEGEDEGYKLSPVSASSESVGVVFVGASGIDLLYLEFADWGSIFDSMTSTFENVRSGISTWVSSVYGDVQSGEIEISELITPQDRAAMLSEEESEAQAIADLAALNIPVDSEREATVTVSETGATLTGTLGLTDSSDGPIEAGTTYDPSTFAGDVYLTADVSQITGTWDAFETGVDGGTITLTSEPYEGTVLDVTTTAGETISIPASDWTDNGDGTYSYDASGDLETAITEVQSVGYASASSETNYETIELSKTFTVDALTNRETGEEESTATFDSSEPQTDSNYITQEEWDQLEAQNQELIDKYEESQNDGGGGGAGAGFFDGGSPDIGLIAAVLGGLGVVYALFVDGGGGS
ncbi:hypothetical protein [Halorubrum salinum]|uniref:hypothetical protein n=1 Tax=Halorubrum salinum TaxID=767517 RepID=UPI0021131892|nr:hypothetical protein [Halorubrum salinum]